MYFHAASWFLLCALTARAMLPLTPGRPLGPAGVCSTLTWPPTWLCWGSLAMPYM